jgi:uncharacterized protein (DUF1778 family)
MRQITFRAEKERRDYWEIAAIAQGYESMSDFIRAAIDEKAQRTPSVLKARKAEIDRLMAIAA